MRPGRANPHFASSVYNHVLVDRSRTRITTMSTAPVNKTEEFVLGVCQRSFLSLWCYNNPKGKDNDELCDVLVVCDPFVIIVSVKEIQLKTDEPTQVHHERWTRKAVEASVSQIYGAERWLASAARVIRADGS